MRRQLVQTVTDVLEKDERVVLLLGDIGVHGFREAFDRFPKRVYNIGILEQASVSLAAGLALDGMIPVFHTIAPFMVERAFEQLKIDFGYQQLRGNFISVGASYDYASLGCTHHCPGDVAILKTIPGTRILVPGHSVEFDALFREHYTDNGGPTYYRLSERSNVKPNPCSRESGLFSYGTRGTVLAVGPMLDVTREACKDLRGVQVRYCTTVSPFRAFGVDVIVMPFYEGSLHEFNGLSIGVPRRFLRNYGTPAEHDAACGLTALAIRERVKEYLKI